MTQRRHAIPLLFLLCAATVAATGHADEKRLYRWVDGNGEVHYSDHLPAEDAKRGRSILNDQGVTVKEIAPPKTAAQLAEEARQAKLRAEQARIAAEKAEKDQQLLNTYQDEDALIHARDSKLGALENVIEVSQGNIRSLQARLGRLTGMAADREREGKPVTSNLQKQIAETRGRIHRTEQFISQKRQEQDKVRHKYSKQLERYRALKAEIAKQQKQSAE